MGQQQQRLMTCQETAWHTSTEWNNESCWTEVNRGWKSDDGWKYLTSFSALFQKALEFWTEMGKVKGSILPLKKKQKQPTHIQIGLLEQSGNFSGHSAHPINGKSIQIIW